MFLDAKVIIKFYIASDISAFLSTFNILCAFLPALKPLFCHKNEKKSSKAYPYLTKFQIKFVSLPRICNEISHEKVQIHHHFRI